MRRCFSPTLSKIRTIFYKARVGREHPACLRVYAVDGDFLSYTIPSGCGVRLFFLLCVRPERSTEVTKTAPHFLLFFINLLGSQHIARIVMSKQSKTLLVRKDLYLQPSIDVVYVTTADKILDASGDDYHIIDDAPRYDDENSWS